MDTSSSVRRHPSLQNMNAVTVYPQLTKLCSQQVTSRHGRLAGFFNSPAAGRQQLRAQWSAAVDSVS